MATMIVTVFYSFHPPAMPNEVVVIDSADEFENGSGDEFEEDNDDEMELAMLDSKLAQIQAKIDVLVDHKVRKVSGFNC